MPDPDSMTDPAGAVEQVRRAAAGDGSGWFEDGTWLKCEDIRAVLDELDRLLSRITELEKALGPFAERGHQLLSADPIYRSAMVRRAWLHEAARVLTKRI